MRSCLAAFALVFSPALYAAEIALDATPVGKDVYVVVGALGGQTYENHGLNNNLGFVVTSAGVVVINTGPGTHVAEALHDVIRRTTTKPVKWVVNVNSQNHYWHGNDYFRRQGATIYAQREAVRVMREMGPSQLASNRELLKEKAANTQLAYPDALVDEREVLRLGGTEVHLLHFGPAHTPGDLVVWLPQKRVAFAGDLVYTDRLLAVIAIGNTGSWVTALDRLFALDPAVIVPGHGRPTDVAGAGRATRDYLVHLREEVTKAIDAGETLQDTVDRVDQSRFRHLANFDLLARRNINQIYLELEREAF